MPLKDTPWGSMRQARSAQHTSGNVPRPPRPTYLPPAPPKCSVSPLPSAVLSIGKSETSVVYEASLNGHEIIKSPPTPDGRGIINDTNNHSISEELEGNF